MTPTPTLTPEQQEVLLRDPRGYHACMKSLEMKLSTDLPYSDLRGGAQEALAAEGIAVFQQGVIAYPNGVEGWLGTIRCERSMPLVVWVGPGEGRPSVQMLPWDAPRFPWDFVQIEQVGDFDGDGTVEVLLDGIGSAGLYSHYPVVLRLAPDGVWLVLFRWQVSLMESYLYGRARLGTSEEDGSVTLTITSADWEPWPDKLRWAFPTSIMPADQHPYKVEVFSFVDGEFRLTSKTPLPTPLQALSDLIMDLRDGTTDALSDHLAFPATVGGVRVESAVAAVEALEATGLGETVGTCLVLRRTTGEITFAELQGEGVAVLPLLERIVGSVRFVCFIGDASGGEALQYLATITTDGKEYRVQSMEEEWRGPYQQLPPLEERRGP